MENRNSYGLPERARKRSGYLKLAVLVAICAFLLETGCGAPGEPTPPSPPIPRAVSDLSGRQSGDGVQLTFTLPVDTVSGERLSEPPAVEILRGATKADGTADAKSFRVVYTIPGSLAENYLAQDHFQFTDPVAPEETGAHPGANLAYRVRTRTSKKRASADSNTIFVPMYPVPERIGSVEARVTETAIELSWSAPTATSGGQPLGAVSAYHIYRGEIDAGSAEAAAKDLSQAKWKAPLALLASSDSAAYRDGLFEFGKTYVYMVRSVVSGGGNELESEDSGPAVITPRDIFPPAAPQDLVAAVVRGAPGAGVEVELSWSINLETDLAGYRVYRSEQEGTRGEILTPELLPTPTYRDKSVEPGHRYWYTVTAVDRAGNESVLSAPAAADAAQPPL
jgi:hypothetical protein